MNFFSSLPISKKGNNRLYLSLLLAIVLGMVFGISVYSYWLIDIIPPTSKRAILYTILAGIVGAVGYFLLLDLWVIPKLVAIQRSARWKLIGYSILMGILLMFAGTSAWQSSSRYIVFFLPTQSLKITVSSPENIANSGMNIWEVETSVGDVPYNTMSYQGWKRIDYRLDLTNSLSNKLEWTGLTGEQVQIFLNVPPQNGSVNISWNGKSELINFSSAINGKLSYAHPFTVPFYASRSMVLLLVVLNFIMACCAINLLIFEKRMAIQSYFQRSILTFPPRQTDYETANTKAGDIRRNAFLGWAAAIGIIFI